MDTSIYTLARNATVAQQQLDAITPLVKQARLVFIGNAALLELHPDQTREADAREASTALAQAILVLDFNLRKIVQASRERQLAF